MGKLLNLLTMFGPLTAVKFWVAVAMSVANFINIYWGVDIGLDQETAFIIINGIGTALVWLLPNKRRDVPVLTETEARARTGYAGPIVDRSPR